MTGPVTSNQPLLRSISIEEERGNVSKIRSHLQKMREISLEMMETVKQAFKNQELPREEYINSCSLKISRVHIAEINTCVDYLSNCSLSLSGYRAVREAKLNLAQEFARIEEIKDLLKRGSGNASHTTENT